MSENFSHKNEINGLFARLEYFDDAKIDPATRKERLADSAAEIIDHCDSLINRHTTAAEATYSTAAIASLRTVQMQIFLRLENAERITSRYDNFVRACASLLNTAYQLEEEDRKNFTTPLIETARAANKYLPVAAKIKNDVSPQEISVPDVLATATFVSDQKYNLNDVRSLFHQLWQVDELQPLLLYSAYATCGYHCNSAGEVSQGQKLQIVLVNDEIVRKNSTRFDGFCTGSNMVMASTGQNRGHFTVINQDTGATLAHELHHYFEESFHQSNQLLPYNPKAFFLSDPNSAIKSRLNLMIEEALACHQKEVIEIPSAISNGRSHTDFQPHKTFGALKSYPGSETSERIRHAEVVVRVSEILFDLRSTKKYSTTEAFTALESFGLKECLAFFHEEREQMRHACTKMQKFSGINFNQEIATAQNIPHYLEYALPSSKSALERDSLNQTTLEIAIQNADHKTTLQFCRDSRAWLEMGSDLKLMHKTACFLAELSTNKNSTFAEEATRLFKSAQSLPYSLNKDAIFNIFFHARNQNLDPDLLAKIAATDDILTAIASGEIPRFDKLKNELNSYLRKIVKDPEKQQNLFNSIIEKYDIVHNQTGDNFLPKHPLRKPLLEYHPQKFLEKFEAAKNSDNSLNPKESGQKLLNEKMGIISPTHDSVIELLAHNCHNDYTGNSWNEVLKLLVRENDIKISLKPKSKDHVLLDLLPENLRADFSQNFAKESQKPNATIQTHKRTAEKVVENVSTRNTRSKHS